MSFKNDLKYKFSRLDAFEKLIAINVTIFLVDVFLTSVIKINSVKYFVLPSEFTNFIIKPWSIFTYGFIHSDLWHLVFNMLFLFYLSKAASHLYRIKTLLNVYFLGIIFGGLLYLLLLNVLPVNLFNLNNGILVGASAGVCALLLFVATSIPNSEIRLFNRFNVKWKHIAIVIVGLDAIRFLAGVNQGGYIAHFGGYLLGYIYATKLIKQGKDIGLGFERTMDTVVAWFKPKPNLKTVHRKAKKEAFAGKTKKEFNTFNKQAKIDLILDKISKSGYESLTAEEKEFLFRAGKK
ncbi:MAG: rhomboid family intramembrane serine protease [Winogradskyella sp.]|uniref:rhomboid family intramembrane serine protease n=1 Tax=Winogradskyella sp. TaxID=1883156 RepID=UPI00179F1A2D|nr:rhomboid family intramembrane serine protease [Winogradskyella sp.]